MKLFFIISLLTSTLFVLYYVLLTEELHILFCRRDPRRAENMCKKTTEKSEMLTLFHIGSVLFLPFFWVAEVCLVQVRVGHFAETRVVCLCLQ
jgi:hypothetical protein